MSHIHNIAGNLSTAAEYQDYLARLRVGRQSKRTSGLSENRGPTTFDSAIDPDRDPDEDRTGGDEEADTPPEGSADTNPEASADANPEAPVDGRLDLDGHGLSAKA